MSSIELGAENNKIKPYEKVKIMEEFMKNEKLLKLLYDNVFNKSEQKKETAFPVLANPMNKSIDIADKNKLIGEQAHNFFTLAAKNAAISCNIKELYKKKRQCYIQRGKLLIQPSKIAE